MNDWLCNSTTRMPLFHIPLLLLLLLLLHNIYTHLDNYYKHPWTQISTSFDGVSSLLYTGTLGGMSTRFGAQTRTLDEYLYTIVQSVLDFSPNWVFVLEIRRSNKSEQEVVKFVLQSWLGDDIYLSTPTEADVYSPLKTTNFRELRKIEKQKSRK